MKEVRPTSGRVLLALFSIIGSVEDTAFLDLFAGTGRVGLEALDRGSSLVVLVESVKPRAKAISDSLPENTCGEARVLALDLRRAIRLLLGQGLTFDFIFADPPYHEGWGDSLLSIKGLPELLKPGGTLIVEHSSREALNVPAFWNLADRRDYGESVLTFFQPGS